MMGDCASFLAKRIAMRMTSGDLPKSASSGQGAQHAGNADQRRSIGKEKRRVAFTASSFGGAEGDLRAREADPGPSGGKGKRRADRAELHSGIAEDKRGTEEVERHPKQGGDEWKRRAGEANVPPGEIKCERPAEHPGARHSRDTERQGVERTELHGGRGRFRDQPRASQRISWHYIFLPRSKLWTAYGRPSQRPSQINLNK